MRRSGSLFAKIPSPPSGYSLYGREIEVAALRGWGSQPSPFGKVGLGDFLHYGLRHFPKSLLHLSRRWRMRVNLTSTSV